jgi:hypothetical protein
VLKSISSSAVHGRLDMEMPIAPCSRINPPAPVFSLTCEFCCDLIAISSWIGGLHDSNGLS